MCVKTELPVGAVQGLEVEVEVHRIMNVGGVGDGLGEEDSSSQDTALQCHGHPPSPLKV